MNTAIIDIKENSPTKALVKSTFSFKTFIKYLNDRIESEQTIKSEFYRFILNKFKAYPHLQTDEVTISAVKNYTDILELVYTILTPAIENDDKFYWALSTPVPSKILYSTDAFFNFLTEHNQRDKKELENNTSLFQDRQLDFIYRLILQKLYNFPSDISNDIIYSHCDAKTNVCKYFKIHTDTSFIEVTFKEKLPEVSAEMIEPCLYEGAGMDVLKDLIPLDLFTLDGFSVITIEDITAEHSIESIRTALVNHTSTQNELYQEVIQSLQILSGNPSIQFGLLPFLRVNGNLIFDAEECANSLLISAAKKYDATADISTSFINEYAKEPKAIFFSSITNKKIEIYPFLNAIKSAGITSYAILPVYYNRQLAGIVEIYSEKKTVFYEKLLSRLESSIPLLSQLLEDSAERFNARIQVIIKNKFTVLQPAVEWKFNEAAWHYLIRNPEDIESTDIKIVSFQDVFPLYGAIDIRNSTIEHNAALHKDVKTLVKLLSGTIKRLKKYITLKEADKLSVEFKKWQKEFKSFLKANDEIMLKSFLVDVIYPYLLNYKKAYPDTTDLLNGYKEAIDEKKGSIYTNRRAIEDSVKQINRTLTTYFEKAQSKLQKIYPCYFEKFRSDGIEYDVYTGQTIAPELKFTNNHLKQFRLWQLRSMIDIAQITNALLPKMQHPLQTAPLIFVHSSKIDICFRNDERRFDVEGYYNIRYEVIKKRIDKVRIKNTLERLTQPDKIALVYFNNDEAEDYIYYIKKFQKEKLLKNDMEFVELEELQGVTGLKALRVSVNQKN